MGYGQSINEAKLEVRSHKRENICSVSFLVFIYIYRELLDETGVKKTAKLIKYFFLKKKKQFVYETKMQKSVYLRR